MSEETNGPRARRILVINGHPDPSPEHLCAALASAYERGARAAGHDVSRLDVGALAFPLIRSMRDYQVSPMPPDVEKAQEAILAADHLVMIFPIWFGSPPAVFKGFLEQALRRGFALSSPQSAMESVLSGHSARLIVTMGMPLPIYRWVLGGHGLSALERGLFWLTGVGPVRRTLFGGAAKVEPATAARWLAAVERLGARGS
ncbi:MAG: NAD(P)H-dependent oxidoreductase [Pseudomonadota bacterium]